MNEIPTLQIDLEKLIATRMLIQANSGGGKSQALRGLLESTHGQVQQIVLDPEGEFSSLREHFDYVIAGKDGDVPATPETARLFCRRLMELGASAVIDLYDLSIEERREYVKLFLEELMALERALWRPLLVVIDEAHNFVPQTGKLQSSDAVIALASQGRKRGFCAILATQRLSKLHKDVAAELLNKLVGRTGLDVDLTRAGDELGFDKKQQAILKRLEPGQFYAYGPAISAEVALVQSGEVKTAHPQAGGIGAPLSFPAPESLHAVLAELGDLPRAAEEEAQTIQALREQLEMLRTAVRTASTKERVVEVPRETIVEKVVEKIVEVPTIAPETVAHLSHVSELLIANGKDMVSIGSEIKSGLMRLEAARDNARDNAPKSTPEIPLRESPRQPAPRAETPRVATPGFTAPQQRILDALAAFRALGIIHVARSNVAVWADTSPTSSGFGNNLGSLRSAGYIDYPAGGLVCLTGEGIRIASKTVSISSRSQLHDAWLARLPNPQARIVRALLKVYPKSMSRESLADLAGASATSSGYGNNLGALRSLGLVDYPQRGFVAATALLFPEGLE